MARLFCIANTVVYDALVTEGVGTSATMVLIEFSRNIQVPKWLNDYYQHWKPNVITMPTLSSLLAQQAIITTKWASSQLLVFSKYE